MKNLWQNCVKNLIQSEKVFEGMPFFSRIAFKQNQQSFDNETNRKLKMIDAREVVGSSICLI